MKFLYPIIWLISLFLGFSQAIVYTSTALVLGTDDQTTNQASYILNGYGIGFENLEITQHAQSLPTLESSAGGKYGLFIIVSQLIVNGTSLLTETQWGTLYEYQIKYGVRMVHLDVYPSTEFGVKAIGSCCGDGIERKLTLVDSVAAKEFPSAGLKATAQLSTLQLFQHSSSIIDANSSTTTAFAQFLPNAMYTDATVAGVINKFDTGREQMVFFLAVGEWSTTSTYLGHAWVNWGYRGTYQGYRRIYLGTQVDDLFLDTMIYNSTERFRLRDGDLEQHVRWSNDINGRLSTGSSYFTEFGFNFNGNLVYASAAGANLTQEVCDRPIFPTWEEQTDEEFIKPLGSGKNTWPAHRQFDFTGKCIFLDPLATFFANTSNRDAVGLVSHTFTHMSFDDATYSDGFSEIEFNLAYAELLNFTSAAKFSGSGLIPPAITGLHNGDVISAWSDNGLWNAVGDNTRPLLRNSVNQHWPLLTTLAENGYDGFQITPRFATRISFDSDQIEVGVSRWVDGGGGAASSTIYNLLDEEKYSVGNQLLSLFHDPYMFHQPNIRSTDVSKVMINDKMQKLSLLQMWVEVIAAEITRLVTWPIITLKHDHIAASFNRRMLLDACKPFIQYITSNGTTIGFTVSSILNICDVPIPVTIAKTLTDTRGFVTEQLGGDPMTIWVKLDGEALSFTFL